MAKQCGHCRDQAGFKGVFLEATHRFSAAGTSSGYQELELPGPEVSCYSCLLLDLATGREEQDNGASIRAGTVPSFKTALLSAQAF